MSHWKVINYSSGRMEVEYYVGTDDPTRNLNSYTYSESKLVNTKLLF